MIKRRLFTVAIAAAACSSAWAQTYPGRPVTLVVGFPPGGGADAAARLVADGLGRQLGQPVVLDYRPGAGGTLASAHVVRSVADGYTLYMTGSNHYGADQLMYRASVRYDGSSLVPIARWTRSPMVLAVSAASGIASVAELIARARAEPGQLAYASSGNGVPPHLAAVLFEQQTRTRMMHVPYKGGAQSVNATAAGDVQLCFATAGSILPLARSGRVKLLAVTSARRSAVLPELPTLAELGVAGYDFPFWFGLFAPAGLPASLVTRLSGASLAALADSALQGRLATSGNEAAPLPATAFADWAAEEGRRMRALVMRAGVTGN